MNTATRPGRWHVASRVFAATLFGFILTNTSGVLLASLLPMTKSEAVTTATLLSFLVYAAIILWIFSVSSLRTMWLGLVLAIVVTSAGAWVLQLLGLFQ